jgi:hypothetical protein
MGGGGWGLGGGSWGSAGVGGGRRERGGEKSGGDRLVGFRTGVEGECGRGGWRVVEWRFSWMEEAGGSGRDGSLGRVGRPRGEGGWAFGKGGDMEGGGCEREQLGVGRAEVRGSIVPGSETAGMVGGWARKGQGGWRRGWLLTESSYSGEEVINVSWGSMWCRGLDLEACLWWRLEGNEC